MAALLCLLPSLALANEFIVTALNSRMQEGVYLLNARIDYRLTSEVREALFNGVPITVQLDIEIQRKRRWWLDATVATLQQRYRLQYHALSHQYQIHNLNSGGYYAYPTLESALDALGNIRDFPLLDKQLVDPEQEYEVLLHTVLDIEALPSPLRPMAYITPAWRLDSDWYRWSLTP
ncbi:MAG: DUF4390 domain-containing protein [Pseudomonadota bacterium]